MHEGRGDKQSRAQTTFLRARDKYSLGMREGEGGQCRNQRQSRGHIRSLQVMGMQGNTGTDVFPTSSFFSMQGMRESQTAGLPESPKLRAKSLLVRPSLPGSAHHLFTL